MEKSTRESFVIRRSFIEPINNLSNEDYGTLLKAVNNYALDGISPDQLSPMLQMAFNFIASTIDRDFEKYQKTVIERNQENGKKGGRPLKNPEEPKKPSGLIDNPKEPKKPVSVSVSVSDAVSDAVSVSDADIYLKEIGVCQKEARDFITSEMWMETKAIQLKTDKEKIISLSKAFLIHLRDTDDIEGKDLQKIRSHFVNWAKIQLEKEKETPARYYIPATPENY
jgi:hypothetical protein